MVLVSGSVCFVLTRADVAAAREKHNTATNDLNRINNEITSTTDTLARMSTGFGPEAEWKKLDGTCVDKVSGEYVDGLQVRANLQLYLRALLLWPSNPKEQQGFIIKLPRVNSESDPRCS